MMIRLVVHDMKVWHSFQPAVDSLLYKRIATIPQDETEQVNSRFGRGNLGNPDNLIVNEQVKGLRDKPDLHRS